VPPCEAARCAARSALFESRSRTTCRAPFPPVRLWLLEAAPPRRARSPVCRPPGPPRRARFRAARLRDAALRSAVFPAFFLAFLLVAAGFGELSRAAALAFLLLRATSVSSRPLRASSLPPATTSPGRPAAPGRTQVLHGDPADFPHYIGKACEVNSFFHIDHLHTGRALLRGRPAASLFPLCSRPYVRPRLGPRAYPEGAGPGASRPGHVL
jgi:hypothetical protein